MLDYRIGFKSSETEHSQMNLVIAGKIPAWLRGDLLRNGPAKFILGTYQVNHWFDGFSMLHRFSFIDEKVNYCCKLLESSALKQAIKKQKLCSEGFASNPGYNFLPRILNFSTRPSDNDNVNIGIFENTSLAMSEGITQLQFDPVNLKTIGQFIYHDKIRGSLTTAHPHYDHQKKEVYNFTIQIGPNCFYNLYRWKVGADKRDLICKIPAKNPGYLHSFGITNQYVILIEQPFILNKLEFLFLNLPYIKNYLWDPSLGACFTVINRFSGEIVLREYTDSFFTFHHVNAYEINEKEILCDVITFKDSSIIDAFYLNNIEKLNIPMSQFRRFHIKLNERMINIQPLSSHSLEFPQINYQEFNSKPYKILYSVSYPNESTFFNQLIKTNLESGIEKIWAEDGCYPGEPVFVPNMPFSEEEGVVLSIILDTKNGCSYLLILNAKSFTEVARAFLPHMIPFGLHGIFNFK